MKRSFGLAVAGWALALAATGVAAWALTRPAAPGPAPLPPEAPPGCDCGPEASPPPVADASLALPRVDRYRVCPREQAPPRWAVVSLWGAPRLAVHCGSTLHVIGFDRAAGDARPRRLARVAAPLPPAGTSPRAVAPRAGDFDGDGHADLLVPMLWVEASGTPRTGALYALPASRSGGFAPARRVLEVTAAAIALGQADGEGPLEIAALHVADPGRPSELWTATAGPSPVRDDSMPLGPGEGWVAWLDLDGDGRQEPLAALREAAGLRRLSAGGPPDGGAGGALAELAAGRGAEPADMDGDGREDLVVLGERAFVLTAGGGPVPREVAGSQGLLEVSAFDVDGDGRLDLLGHDGTRALLLTRADGAGGFVRRELLAVEGQGVTPVSIRAAHVDADGRADAVLLGLTSGAEPQVEIGVVTDLANTPGAVLARRAEALADAPLSLRVALP